MNLILKILFKLRAYYYKKHLLPYFKKREKVLDVGAGSGFISKYLSKKCFVELVDVKDYNQTLLPIKIFDGQNLPYKRKSFDTCLLVSVLHHTSLQKQINLLKEAKRVGKRLIIVEALQYNFIQRLWLEIYDSFWNFITHVPIELTFHPDETWKYLFKEIGLKVKSEKEFLSATGLIKLKIYELV